MYIRLTLLLFIFLFFTDPATTEIYTLSLHDALPILLVRKSLKRFWSLINIFISITFTLILVLVTFISQGLNLENIGHKEDRKSTRLNSSHTVISYAVFCLKKKTDAN